MSNEARNVRLITTALLLGLILSSIDQTIVSTAMPSVSKELGGLSLYSWVFAIYMLTSTTSMPIYGKMADLFGRKKMYLIGLFFFLTGSLLCGFAQTMSELIVYRGIQGLGAGALMPIAFTIIADVYPPEKIGKFQGLFSAVFAVSSVLGPAVGGMIVEQWDWGWIFFINLPIGIPAFILLAVSLTEKKGTAKRSIDWLGAVTLCGAVISLLLAMVLAGNEHAGGTPSDWQSPRTIGLLGSSAILIALFLWIETKAKEPILPLHLFRLPAIAFGNICGFFVSAALFSAIACIPLFVQSEIGMSPSQAGYLLSPLMLATIVTSTIGGRLMSKVSYRSILIPSLAVMAVGFYLLQQMEPATTTSAIVLNLIVIGLGMGAIYPTLGTAAVRAVDPVHRGVATSSSQFFRSIGGTIGVSVMGSLLSYSHRAVFLAGLFFVCVSLLSSFFLGKARLLSRKRL
ncbi:MDR family MFS transporter [Brevibacillus choshinensis]|uniref:MFS transporter n=1 Tax=Brevibacillus choshinensis TaxID=54911 RepID=A0ABX7FQE3_BRECH|nr:MDR family MFS transporter [Brevibacillus choshinensis]QRG68461.1 MFS transporter [Brevibacillus choshinensis]